MQFRRSLRYRVGFALALFGGAASLLLSAVLFFYVHRIEGRFVDDALDSELEEFFALRAANPGTPLPRTSLVRAYAVRAHSPDPALPRALPPLAPGRHQLSLDGKQYRAAVVDRGDQRLYLLYDESGLLRREGRLKAMLATGVIAMMLLSAGTGVWLAGLVIAPVRQLGERVQDLDPTGVALRLAKDFAADEVGQLAGTIEGYSQRLHDFIERERNFTADASHELRTPLSIIGGATEVVLADRELPEATRARLERIARAAHDMRIVMDGLLALAREPERARASRDLCDVAEVVHAVVEQHRPLGHGRPVTLALHVAAGPRLPAEPALLAVAAGNLVRNALAYTRQGEVTVRVEPDRLVVEDTGPGLGTHGPAPLAGRTGIGLSLVRRVCERYGWKLVLDDRPNGGTRAEILFAEAPSATA